ncbi:MAG: hypothetical protein JST54_18160 [Deltaproteobacteria bacterium]|nr:hypothetical protein [Deltaproteobacteria bacterium]
MAGRKLSGCELWPVPGFLAQGALRTASGSAPVALAGPRNAEAAVIVAGASAPVVQGLAAHAARQGLAVFALGGRAGHDAQDVLAAAGELALMRGVERVGLCVHGGWAEPGLRVAPALAEVLAVLDPDPVDPSVDPERLRGIPLWIATGTAAAPAAQALHARARHPRSLIELPAVPALQHAVNDVAAEIVPFLRHGLRRR